MNKMNLITCGIFLCLGLIAGNLLTPTKIVEVMSEPVIKVETVPEYVIIEPEFDPERECLAQTIYAEARGESVKGQMAVAQVIMNRVEDERFPDTICEVVSYKPSGVYHFSYQYRNDPNFYRTARVFSNMQVSEQEEQARQKAYDISDLALAGIDLLPTTSLNYHNTSVSPSWSTKLVVHSQVGNHVFYQGY